MTDRPILFSAPMVRALLAGTKTQTRRLFKGIEQMENGCFHIFGGMVGVSEEDVPKHAPDYVRIQVGDQLWVKETWRPFPVDLSPWDMEVAYFADGERRIIKDGEFGERDWSMPKAAVRGNVTPLFMPRWASRLTLTVTDVRVERLQEISEVDAQAEGIVKVGRFFGLADADWDAASTESAVDSYAALWESINGARSWDDNPWVVAYTFTVQRSNIDQLAKEAA